MSKPATPACHDVTPWFPAHIKPVRVGVYQRPYGRAIHFAYWNGRFWGCTEIKPEDAYLNGQFASFDQTSGWRGLARNPK